MFKSLAFAGLLLALLHDQAAAQQPTEAQRDAIRAACRSDFMTNCSGVQPGGKEAFECLLRTDAGLSPSCRAAVNAAAPKPSEPAAATAPAAPAPAAPAQSETAPKPTAQQTAAVRASCRSDFMSHCSGVQPGGAEALQCLKRNEAQLAAACRSAVAAIGGGGGAAAPSGAPAAAAAPAVAPIGPMPMLRPREALAIVQICGVEVRSLCAGVPFGGGRVISCLAANASSLSPGCYSALSAAAGR